MKDIKLTLKSIFANWLPWGKMLWKPYLLFAAAASFFVYAFMRVSASALLPMAMLWSEIHDWGIVFAIVGLDILWSVLCLLSLVAAVVASVKAHLQMRNFIAQFTRREMSRSHRNVLIVNVVLITIGSIMVALLPMVALFVSYVVAALSGMMLDEVATPSWLHAAMLLCTFIGVLFCELVLTFVRLCYCELPEIPKLSENEIETHLSVNLPAAVSASC